VLHASGLDESALRGCFALVFFSISIRPPCASRCILLLLSVWWKHRHRKRIAEITCLTRDGWRYPGVDLNLFRKLRRKKAVSSCEGGPYRITRRGLELVRSQLDNR
jgi:uncharacterized protein YjhX (UPF0386 family)